ncbi:MAG: TetR/AcrR family transcriptional regulator [Flavobacteriales bacterium]
MWQPTSSFSPAKPLDQRGTELRSRCTQLFGRFGIKALSMDDLAGHLACSKKTLYKYFKDKRDLVSQALHSHIDGLEAQMHELMTGEGNAIDLALAEMEKKHKMLSAISSTVLFDLKKYYPKVFEATHARRRNMIRRLVVHNVTRGMDQGVYRQDLNVEAVADLHLALVEDMVRQAENGTLERPLAEHFKELFTYHIRGIASAQGLDYLESKLSTNR